MARRIRKHTCAPGVYLGVFNVRAGDEAYIILTINGIEHSACCPQSDLKNVSNYFICTVTRSRSGKLTAKYRNA